jgi:hypothetical protein
VHLAQEEHLNFLHATTAPALPTTHTKTFFLSINNNKSKFQIHSLLYTTEEGK